MLNNHEIKSFKLRNFELKSGNVINLEIKYLAFGNLNPEKSNVILYPTRYAGTHLEQGYIIGDDQPINQKEYFIIIPNMFCNGVSSSPSNTDSPFNGPNFPLLTIQDNVSAQNELIKKVFNIEKIKLVIGWSMGGQQAYQWATQFPDTVENILAMCAHAKTSGHTHVFLEGMYAALTSDLNWNKGRSHDNIAIYLNSLKNDYDIFWCVKDKKHNYNMDIKYIDYLDFHYKAMKISYNIRYDIGYSFFDDKKCLDIFNLFQKNINLNNYILCSLTCSNSTSSLLLSSLFFR